MAWTLHRIQAAPSLEVSVGALDDWASFEDLESAQQAINRLQEHVKAAVAASRGLRHLKVLVIGFCTIVDSESPYAHQIGSACHAIRPALQEHLA